jgi:hypothetical protein
MGAWYWIGVSVGIGVALGISAAAIVPRWLVAAVLGAAAGAVLGFFVLGWPEAIGGGAGGVAGAAGTGPVIAGALRRGGTRLGLVVFALVGALAVVALAFVPVLGYLEAVALPALGRRLRSRTPERYAGLRTLARD